VTTCPRECAIVFGDLIGKVAVLGIECAKWTVGSFAGCGAPAARTRVL
jgi:hypothetical protein